MLKVRSEMNISCAGCRLSHLCVARQFTEQEKVRMDKFIEKVKYIKKGERLYQNNEKMEYLYAVYSGTLKDYYFGENGEEYINNFYLPGDIVALEAIAHRKYTYSAVALSDAVLCAIPMNNLFSEMHTFPSLLKNLLQINSYQMLNNKHMRPTTNARHRVADFLVNILHRLQERKSADVEMQLPMSQVDMSNMIGIAYETVSRVLRQLADEKIIKISNRSVTVLNPKLLSAMGNDIKVLGRSMPMLSN